MMIGAVFWCRDLSSARQGAAQNHMRANEWTENGFINEAQRSNWEKFGGTVSKLKNLDFWSHYIYIFKQEFSEDTQEMAGKYSMSEASKIFPGKV